MPDDAAERDIRRASLYARYVNLRCDMTQALMALGEALQNSQAPAMTPEQVAEWVRDAEHYSELHETRSGALFTETVDFLSNAVVAEPPVEMPEEGQYACVTCGARGRIWSAAGWLCLACNGPIYGASPQ